jgi:predicted ATPase/DNA-binding CsgD family transcriptional regulator
LTAIEFEMSDSEKAVWSEPLSLREIEILRLISEGLSNREIAEQLVLSVDTIKWYNKQIFSKLGVSSRTQAASFLRQNSSLVSSPSSTGESEIGLRHKLPEHNLPLPLNSFLGREDEIALIKSLLGDTPGPEAKRGENARLVTLTGPGGVGKTRLAVQTALGLVKKFSDGVWLIDFAPLSDPLFVPQTVVATLGIWEDGSTPMLTNLIAYLREKRMLLVFDNCEHLIDACAQLTAAILPACPGVSVLATSREALGIAGEYVLTVAPFAIPDAVDAHPLEIQSMNEAVRLFVERARSNQAEFSLSTANALSVLEVCRRLDGLPLAIELAAARVKMVAVSEIAARLEDSFQLLGHGDRTALPRAQTLQACMDWSYTLLSDEERLLLNRLAVFVGGWTLPAAEMICAGGQINPPDVFHLLAQLIEKSLVVVDRRQPTGIRYRFLETIYRYALEKLNASGESATLRGRHLVYFLNIAENREVNIPDRELIEWLNWMDSEHDNLRAALDWSLNEQIDPALCYRLARQLGDFWEHHGFLDEGRARFAKILARPGATETSLEIADLLFQYAWFAVYQSDHQAGRRLLEQSRAMFERLHPQGISSEVNVLNSLAAIEIDSGEASIARDYAQKALEVANRNDYPYGASFSHHLLGVALGHLGEYDPAWKHMQASLAINSKINRGSMSLYHNMGELAVRQGDYEKGKVYLQHGIQLTEEAGDKWNLAAALGTLGWVELIQEEYHLVRRHLRESIMIRQTIGDKGGIAWCLEKLADLALRQGSPDKATTILGAAAALRSEANSTINSADKPIYDALLVSLHEHLEPHAFQTAWEAGARSPLEEAIRLSLET